MWSRNAKRNFTEWFSTIFRGCVVRMQPATIIWEFDKKLRNLLTIFFFFTILKLKFYCFYGSLDILSPLQKFWKILWNFILSMNFHTIFHLWRGVISECLINARKIFHFRGSKQSQTKLVGLHQHQRENHSSLQRGKSSRKILTSAMKRNWVIKES